MHIVSKFADYYDKVGPMYGIDRSIIYVRHQQELDTEDTIGQKEFRAFVKLYDSILGKTLNLSYPVEDKPKEKTKTKFNLVGFCGKVYVILVNETNKDIPGKYYSYHDPAPTIEILAGASLIKRLTELSEEREKDKKGASKSYTHFNPFETTLEAIKEIEQTDFTKLFFHIKAPVFMYTQHTKNPGWNTPSSSIIINPILKDTGFIKVKNPNEAFQEIQQYISGVLGTGHNEPVVTDDRYKILAAGFDLKTSFRKDAGKSKPRKGK